MRKASVVFLLCFISVISIAQKKVLFEKYTNAFCGICPDATIQLKNMVLENPDVIWISHQKPIGFMEHPLTNPSSDAIWDELGINGVPTGMIDRTVYSGDITMGRSAWESRTQDHLTNPNTFDIGISEIEYEPISRELEFQVDVEALVSGLTGPFRVTAYIVEDSIIAPQSSYWNDEPGHPLEGLGDLIENYVHRNLVRDMLEDHWGVSNVVPDMPELGTTYTHTFQYTVREEINPVNVHLVTMVSEFDEQNNYPGVVHNVTRVKLKELGIKLTSAKDVLPLEFSIGPNPTSDFIDLQFESIPDQIVITDISGSIKTRLSPNGLNTRIDLDGYHTGIYFILVEKEGKEGIQRFSVNE